MTIRVNNFIRVFSEIIVYVCEANLYIFTEFIPYLVERFYSRDNYLEEKTSCIVCRSR